MCYPSAETDVGADNADKDLVKIGYFAWFIFLLLDAHHVFWGVTSLYALTLFNCLYRTAVTFENALTTNRGIVFCLRRTVLQRPVYEYPEKRTQNLWTPGLHTELS